MKPEAVAYQKTRWGYCRACRQSVPAIRDLEHWKCALCGKTVKARSKAGTVILVSVIGLVVLFGCGGFVGAVPVLVLVVIPGAFWLGVGQLGRAMRQARERQAPLRALYDRIEAERRARIHQ